MPYKIFVKVGRILIGLGIGTLIGITCAVLDVGSNNIDNFGIIIFLGALAIISGITIIIKTKIIKMIFIKIIIFFLKKLFTNVQKYIIIKLSNWEDDSNVKINYYYFIIIS